MPRFAVLQHDSPRGLHWDFLLEHEGALLTWALPQPPDVADTLPADKLPDHRLDYLDYEGPVSGNRGAVVRWDQGTCRFERRTDDAIVVALDGERLIGRATLQRRAGDPAGWWFRFEQS